MLMPLSPLEFSLRRFFDSKASCHFSAGSPARLTVSTLQSFRLSDNLSEMSGEWTFLSSLGPRCAKDPFLLIFFFFFFFFFFQYLPSSNPPSIFRSETVREKCSHAISVAQRSFFFFFLISFPHNLVPLRLLAG